MKRKLTYLVLMLVVGVAAGLLLSLLWKDSRVEVAPKVSVSEPQSRLEEIKARGYLVAGTGEYPPFTIKEQDKYRGFDVDIIKYIAKKLGVKVKFIVVTQASRISTIEGGVVDIVGSTLTHTKTRDARADYSITYFYDGQKILVKKGSGIKSYRDLAGKKVGAPKGTTSERNIARVQPKAKVISFLNNIQTIAALQDGVIDACTTDSTILLGMRVNAERPEDYEIVGEYFSAEPYGLAVPENDSKWRDFVNECLIEMWATGEWKKVYDKHFGPGTKYELPTDFEMSTWPLR